MIQFVEGFHALVVLAQRALEKKTKGLIVGLLT
jgi:hypothetical protein